MCARTPYHMKAQREIQPHARHPPHVQLCSPGPSLPPQAIPQTPYRLHHAHSSPPSPPVPRPRYLLQALPSLDGRVSVNSMHIREPPACRCARILTKLPPHTRVRAGRRVPLRSEFSVSIVCMCAYLAVYLRQGTANTSGHDSLALSPDVPPLCPLPAYLLQWPACSSSALPPENQPTSACTSFP